MKGERVRINTDTAYDTEGIPVSIRPGAAGRVHEESDGWAQVIVNFEGGPELLGVEIRHLSKEET